jgi:DNA-binding LacI/PurR family transcriptional regulator
VGNRFLNQGLKISDVARHASVSPATVSRVLNGDSRVGDVYRARVLRAVEELDYRPNVLARNLRRQRTATIGVVVPDIENPHFGELVRSVEDQAFDAGYRVLVCNTDETAEKQRAYLEALIDERVLGVIISPSDPGGEQIAQLLDLGIPVVACDREVDDARADAVLADNVKAVRIGSDVLIAGGHRRIAFIGGRADVETGAERLAGYEMAMRAAGLETLVVDGDFRLELAETAVAELLRRDPRPTAFIVANNLMTLGALRAIREAGLRVPGDVALVGVDDPPWSALVDPPLTTLGQPVRAMAADAMELLLQRVSGTREQPRRIVHPFQLRARAST